MGMTQTRESVWKHPQRLICGHYPWAKRDFPGIWSLRTLALENPSHPDRFLPSKEFLLELPRQIRMEELGGLYK